MRKIKGCYGENLAVCHFQKEGKYVFKACQRNGPIDIITVDPDNYSPSSIIVDDFDRLHNYLHCIFDCIHLLDVVE